MDFFIDKVLIIAEKILQELNELEVPREFEIKSLKKEE